MPLDADDGSVRVFKGLNDTIERLGFDYVEDKLLHGKVDKETVMKKNVVGGATC